MVLGGVAAGLGIEDPRRARSRVGLAA